MILQIVLALAVLILIIIYFTISSNHNYFNKIGVPQTKPLYFYGDYKEIFYGRKHYGIFINELYEANKHLPYLGFYALNTPMVLVNDQELIKNIIIKDFAHFANNNFEPHPDDKLFCQSAFSARDENWRRTRAIATQNFTSMRMKLIFPLMEEKANNMVTYINEYIENNPQELLSATLPMELFTTDVIAGTTFGADINSFKDPHTTYRQITKSIHMPVILNNFLQLLPLVYPIFQSLSKVRFIKDDTSNAIIELTKDAIVQISKSEDKGNNLISKLLELRQKYSSEVISDLFIAGQIWTYFIDGYETATVIIMFALYELGLNMDVQELLRKEIDDCYDRNEGKLNYDDLINLKYLDMVVSEATRVHSPFLILERVCTKPYIFPPAIPGAKPLRLEPGMPVVISILAVHMNEKYYPQPEKFNPENFSAKAVAARPKCTYLTFGEGPRVCIGSRLGLAEVKLAIATILRHFQVKTPPACVNNAKTISLDSLVIKPHEDMKLSFSKRK